MKRIHIVPGLGDVANGLAVIARLFAKEQGDADVVDLYDNMREIHEKEVDEVWIHGMWQPREWIACSRVLRAGKRLVRMTHGSLSPICLKQRGRWKKWVVGPIERFFLRRADVVVATCEAEAEWIRQYEPRVKKIEVTDVKRFFDFSRKEHKERKGDGKLHLLYLGRRHPLKGLEFLEAHRTEIPIPVDPGIAVAPEGAAHHQVLKKGKAGKV